MSIADPVPAGTTAPSPCRICSGPAVPTPWGSLRCTRCRSESARELPTEEELTAFYATFTDTYTGGGTSGGRNQERYAHWYLRTVQRYLASGHLADIGCANNPFPNLAAAAGFRVTAVDYERPGNLDPAVEYVAGNLNTGDLSDRVENLDAVTAWAVLEHCRNPDLAVAELAATVGPGGWVFLSSPEAGTRLARFSLGRTPWFYPPEHLNLISPRGYRHLARRHGLEVVKLGRVELSPWRWAARYGIGLAESVVGAPLTLIPRWRRAVESRRRSRYAGISYCVLRRLPAP